MVRGDYDHGILSICMEMVNKKFVLKKVFRSEPGTVTGDRWTKQK